MRVRPKPRPLRRSAARVHGEIEGERSSAWAAVYRIVRRIPRGRVMTYGQIATLVENRLSPRAVGWAMHGCPQGVPWQRVVNAGGACSTDRLPGFPQGLQRALLEAEGVRFRRNGTLDLADYRWHPAPAKENSMLRRRIRILAALALLALPAGAAETTPAPLPSVDELVAKYLTAIGGRDKLKALESVRMSGKMILGEGMEAPFTVELKRPSAVRMDVTYQGTTASVAFDGEKGWRVAPLQGSVAPEPLSADESMQAKEQADIEGPLVDYKEKGSTVELVGKESVEGADAFKLKVTDKDGSVRNIYLRAQDYLPIKETMKRTIQGSEMEFENSIGEYKEVGGVKFAHSIETKVQGVSTGQAMRIEKIEPNAAIDPARFQMPAAPKPDAVPSQGKQPETGKPDEKK